MKLTKLVSTLLALLFFMVSCQEDTQDTTGKIEGEIERKIVVPKNTQGSSSQRPGAGGAGPHGGSNTHLQGVSSEFGGN